PAIEKALRRRLTGFEATEVDWAEVTHHAEGLSTADVVAAAEDAARRTVLGNLDSIETAALIASLDRRRSLHGIGGMVGDAEGSQTLHTARSRKAAGLQGQGRRVIKK